MGLGIRIMLYVLSGAAAAFGLGDFDQEAGKITLDLKSLELALAGVITPAVTFAVSRWVKHRGGLT